jgi:PAS domain S-box-containing protein
MTGSYDYSEVARSVLIAIAASYAALDLTGRVAAASGRVRLAWLSGGAISMGIGIWTMHLKGMLAFGLPVTVEYYWPTLLAGLSVAIFASAVALYVTSRQKMSRTDALTGSVVMGAGIAGLHYTLMAAMRMPAITRYSPLLVACSILLAVLFSLIALLMAFGLREETRWTVPRRLGSAVVMGAAISAMHYTGMAAASFIPAPPPDFTHAVSISAVGNNAIGIVTLIVLAAAMVTSSVDRRATVEFERHNQELERRVLERTSQLITVNEELAETEERFRKLVEALPDALYVHSEGRIVFVNPFGMRLLGAQQPEQLAGKDIFEIVHPDYREVIRQRIQHCYQTGTASSPMECALVALDGSFVEVESAGIPITWKGSPAVEVVARDIRERKRAEEQLRQAQTRTESVLDSMADTHILLDRGWHYLYVNRAAVLAMARPREQILGHTLWELYPDIIGTELERQYRRAMEERIPVIVDFHYPATNTWWENRFYPAPEGLSVFATDITERKRAEEALQESQSALARVARIATMGELTASIAHEINQPLAAVATNASASLHWLALQPPNLAEARQAMTNAMKEANRASRVIDRIRALLRKAPPELRPLDVNEVIREVLALAHKELTVGGVAVHTELSPEVPTVLADRVQLQQVMLNLIMNAIDAMLTIKDRPRTLLIKSARDAGGVLVEVQDSGRGLDPKQASRIFDSFFTTKPEGIGMGLSISRSIVEAHGGHLRAVPASLHGAIFQFILPKADRGA